MFQLTGESHLSPYGESLTNHRVAVETKILLVQGCQNKYLKRMQPGVCPSLGQQALYHTLFSVFPVLEPSFL